jgi:pimeloyl-ACP methyl ester carboxylesterase
VKPGFHLVTPPGPSAPQPILGAVYLALRHSRPTSRWRHVATRLTPVWGRLKAAAPTLPYDITIMHEHQKGRPLTTAEWAAIKVPALVAAGGKSPAWMTNGTRALAGALPDATYRTLPGQNHMVKAQAIAPVLTEFFVTRD